MKILSYLVALWFVVASQAESPWETSPRKPDWWQNRHKKFLNSTATLGNKIKIVFLGSSLIEYWSREGKLVWNQNYAPLDAINYGIGGDQTQHVLWRIEEGELDGLTPKLVVLYIGSNNVPVFSNNTEIVHGVNTVVTKLHEKLPTTNILLVATFPRGDQKDTKWTLERIRDINENVKGLVSGDAERKSHFLDLFSFLANKSVDGINQELYVADKLHLNKQGYEMWAREMNSTIHNLLE